MIATLLLLVSWAFAGGGADGRRHRASTLVLYYEGVDSPTTLTLPAPVCFPARTDLRATCKGSASSEAVAVTMNFLLAPTP